MKLCGQCGDPINPPTRRSEAQLSRMRFCSRECVSLSRKVRVTEECSECGASFERRPYHPTKTCSRACQAKRVSRKLMTSPPCTECGKPITVRSWKKKRRCATPSCQKSAMRKRREARFWTFVQKGDHCWEWTGRKNPQGYGAFAGGGAYRFALELATGPLGDLLALHKCNNKGCVRVGPGHLYRGTYADNQRDRVETEKALRALTGVAPADPSLCRKPSETVGNYQFRTVGNPPSETPL